MLAQNDDLDAWRMVANMSRRLSPVQQRHTDIHHSHIGLELLGSGNQGPSVRSRTDYLEIFFEKATDSFEKKCVIIRKQ
jgi:hypothetical protein